MNVLLISQCDKRALLETRRILDQFAERRGDRTWQTPITQDGLNTLRKLLRKTARKNTAVACHWIRGIDHSQLLWTVGDPSRFNAQGAVPTNTTKRNVLRQGSENDWHTGQAIGLLAQLASLLHDLGKATVAFQERLRGGRRGERNLIRHEWASLRYFQAFVADSADVDWLSRLADADAADAQLWLDPKRLLCDGLDDLAVDQKRPFPSLPPLAAAVGWLVLTHHRLPVPPPEKLGEFTAKWLEEPLAQVTHAWNEDTLAGQSPEAFRPYWKVNGLLPVMSVCWRKEAARLARKLLSLHVGYSQDWLGNPFVMHLARLSLMLADHHYSSLPADSAQRVKGDRNSNLFANTDAAGALKQALDEHLLGVAKGAGLIAHALPSFARELPALAEHKGLRKRSGPGRFAWQDKAADAAAGMRDLAQQRGGFIINMASTGCGKTLANARMLYALADPKRGLRAAYALGLRTLTLQTGRSYRQDLQLKDEDLAILVGGSANRALFEYYEAQSEATGSASVQDLLEEDSHLVFEGDTHSHPLLARALADTQIQRLLLAPLLVCTVDHLAPATESLRAGRQIAPMLRLLSGDLVLDELDDYDLADLPALTRLVYWAGLLGSRVILSSATLPPALVDGMFAAYRAGRTQYQRNRGTQGELTEQAAQERLVVPCLWADEFGVLRADCAQVSDLTSQHAKFVTQRVAQLAKALPLRRAVLEPLQLASQLRHDIAQEFAPPLMQACLRLHQDHAELDPATGKKVSFGLLRMANVEPLFDTARAFFALDAPEDTRIHLCVYHARFPLLQRSAIEHQLDAVFNRRDPQAVWGLPFIRAALNAAQTHHLFVVLASPVCEVGRDWDASWAVAEPSSMRSLIQLAGRVQRHRSHAPSTPNVLVFDTNLKNFRQSGVAAKDRKAIFLRPGFEANVPLNEPFRLRGNRLGTLLRPQEFEVLTAKPRIQPAAESDAQRKLVDLEHARMADSMLPKLARATSAKDLNAASGWQFTSSALNGVLPRLQRFRAQTQVMETLVFLPDDDGEALRLHRVEESRQHKGQSLYIPVHDSLLRPVPLTLGQGVGAWGSEELMSLVQAQAEAQDMSLRRSAEKFTVVEVPQSTQGWRHHPWLGFSAL